MNINNMKIGIVGFGNMGQAMAKGWVEKGGIPANHISASARDYNKLKNNCEKIGIKAVHSSLEMVKASDVIVLAVKPYQIEAVVAPLIDELQRKIIISVAAGYTNEMYQGILLDNTAVLCTIPNTPVTIGEGIVVAENNHSLSDNDLNEITVLLEKLGRVEFVETSQLDIAGTIAGCGPAFASLFIEALGDAAVKYGLSRKEAYQLASQMLVGTGKMHLETGEHPGAMKDAVTSPGGTTIKGVSALEANGFRSAVISAIDAIEG